MINKSNEPKINQAEISNEYGSTKEIVGSNPTEIDAINLLNQFSEEDKIDSTNAFNSNDYTQNLLVMYVNTLMAFWIKWFRIFVQKIIEFID